MKTELDPGDKHLMRLIRKGQCAEGWAKVSTAIWPLMQKLPSELVTLRKTQDGGYAALTDKGNTVLDWT